MPEDVCLGIETAYRSGPAIAVNQKINFSEDGAAASTGCLYLVEHIWQASWRWLAARAAACAWHGRRIVAHHLA